VAAAPTFVCEIAFGNNPGDASPSWTDVSAYLRSFHITRGRQYELNQMQAGTCDITLKNLDRRFDPTYSSSPYYPYLRPMVPVRMSGSVRPVMTNLCTNPSVETALGLWNPTGGISTLTRDATHVKFGAWAMKWVGAGVGGGPSLFPVTGLAAATAYTLSAWLFSAAGGESCALRVDFYTAVPALVNSSAVTTVVLAAGWNRLTTTGTSGAGVDRANLLVMSRVAGSQTFWTDGVQLEQSAAATDYCDGDQPGCSWTGAAHASTSTVTTYRLFTGYVERFPQNRTGPTYAETQVQAVDGFELLTNSVLPGATYPQELSGTRVTRVLDAASWSSTARSISAGQSLIIAYTFADVDFVDPLSHLQDVSTSELGIFFISSDGKATFRDRLSNISPASLGTFTDQPTVDTGDIGYADIVVSLDKDLIFNDWRGTRSGGTIVQEALDSISIGKYFQRAQSRTPLLPDDLSTLSQMQSLLNAYKEPTIRASQITVTPGNSIAAWLQVLTRDLGDMITARAHPPGGGIPFVQDSLIQQIDLTVDTHAASAKCVYGLLPGDPSSFLVLNDATSGTLDSTNWLGY